MAQRLILHIGTHKTGTSTLQAHFSKGRDALAKAGILYPRTDRPPAPNRFKQAFFGRTLLSGAEAFAALWADMLDEFAGSGCHTILISEEGLSGPAMTQRVDLLELCAKDFEIEAVCYLRRQDSFAESFWNQSCKSNMETLGIVDFVRQKKIQRHMRYLDMLDQWSRVAKVTAVGFETARQEGLEQSFAKATGIEVPVAGNLRNVSPSMTMASLLCVMNRRGDVPPWEELEPLMRGQPTRFALGSKLRREILETFAEHNAALREKYGVTFPEDMPEEGEDPLAEPTAAEVAELRKVHAILARRVAKRTGSAFAETAPKKEAFAGASTESGRAKPRRAIVAAANRLATRAAQTGEQPLLAKARAAVDSPELLAKREARRQARLAERLGQKAPRAE